MIEPMVRVKGLTEFFQNMRELIQVEVLSQEEDVAYAQRRLGHWRDMAKNWDEIIAEINKAVEQ